MPQFTLESPPADGIRVVVTIDADTPEAAADVLEAASKRNRRNLDSLRCINEMLSDRERLVEGFKRALAPK